MIVRRPRPAPLDRRRGVALLLSLIMVVMLTAFISEFNYSSRVRILSAMHARDDAKAHLLAESGIRIYSLLLLFGRQSSSNPMIQQVLEPLGFQLDGSAMVCQSIPLFDSALLRFLMGSGGSLDDEEEGIIGSLLGGDEGGEAPGAAEGAPVRGAVDRVEDGSQEGLRRKLLDFEGDFRVECQDDNGKVNLNGFAKSNYIALPLEQHPTALMLYGLMASEDYDPLFEDRLKMDRWELIGNIKDWIDIDQNRSGAFGGDEDAVYDDYRPRYRAKNQPLDTVEEVRMVHGVTDEVWAIFKDHFSVATRNLKVNVNTAPANMLFSLIRAYADPAVTNELIQQKVSWLAIERSLSPFRNARDFVNRVKQQSVPLPDLTGSGGAGQPTPGIPIVNEADLRNLVKTSSNLFRLVSTGYLGDSARRVEVVVRVRSNRTSLMDVRER